MVSQNIALLRRELPHASYPAESRLPTSEGLFAAQEDLVAERSCIIGRVEWSLLVRN